MGLFSSITSAIFDSQEIREQKKLEQVRFGNVLNNFLEESEIRYKLQNKDAEWDKEHQFYRYVYRRCKVIEYLIKTGETVSCNISIEDINKIEVYASKVYFQTAPENLYGTPPLKLTIPIINKLEKLERISTADLLQNKNKQVKIQGQIYLGQVLNGKVYVGQTTRYAERRYIEHREYGTGPYKEGADSVNWKIIHSCSAAELNYWESYYIGFYNSFESGYNDTYGNDLTAYQSGKSKSINE